MKKTLMLLALAAGLPLFGAGPFLSRAYLTCRTAKENPLAYKVSEKIYLDFKIFGEDIPSNETFIVHWALVPDGARAIGGTNAVTLAKGCRIETVRTTPGFVWITAWLGRTDGSRVERDPKSRMGSYLGKNVSFSGSAGVEVEKLRPAEPEPADFDAFWAEAKKELAAVPMNPKLEEVPDDSDKVSRCYRAEIGCLGPRPVTGFLNVPRRCFEDPTYKVPVVLAYDGAGFHPPEKREKGFPDAIRFHVNAHGVPLGKDREFYGQWFAPLRGGDTKGPRYTGMYVYDEKKNADPRTSYMFGMVLRVIRSVEFARSLEWWNGYDVKVMGGSQGGLQTMWAAGLADGVTRAEPWVTWSCDLGGFKQGRFSAGSWRIPYAKGIFYYDPVFMARRIPKTCFLDISRAGLGDNVAPPSGIMISYNECKAPKRARFLQGSHHGDSMPPGDRQAAIFTEGPVHEFPAAGWQGARVDRDRDGRFRILDETGREIAHTEYVQPASLASLLKISVDDTGVTVDTSAMEAAAKGESVNVTLASPRFEAPELPGRECRCRLALSSDDNMAKVRHWIIGSAPKGNKMEWMAFGPYGGPYLRVSKKERAEYDVPYTGNAMPVGSCNYTWRFDFAGARAPVKLYGARIAPYTELKAAKPFARKVEPKLTFHASFDRGTPEADFAAGAKAPKKSSGLAYEPGRAGGRAVRLAPSAKPFLLYDGKDNMTRGRGSLAIWYRSCLKKAVDGSFLFAAGSDMGQRMGTGFPFLWFWRNTLRFDPSSDNDGYQMCGVGVSDPNWHHLVVAWNEYGSTFWVDGTPAPGDTTPISKALAYNDRIAYSRAAVPGSFAIGSQIDGRAVYDCLVDDVKIYSDALNDAQVRALWKKDGGVPPPAPDFKAALPAANRYEGGVAKTPGRIDPGDLELVEEIKLDHIPTKGEFRAVGKLAVKELAGVRYLEVENIEKSRFAVGLHLTDSPLHLIEVDYPDDCCRTMEFVAQPAKESGHDYALQVGVLTGRDVAGAGSTPTKRILTHRMPLWTRDPHVAFVAMSWHKEEAGAAIAAIRAYRIKSGRLPQAKIVEPQGAPVRSFGIHYEDTPLGDCFAAPDNGQTVPGFIDAVERLAATMKFTGQNLFSFPVSWYRGVNDPALRERHPAHFSDGLMTVFDREGLGFMASINTYALPIPTGLVTSDSIRDGSLHSSFLSMPATGRVGSNSSRYNIAHPETQRLLSETVDYLIAEGVRHPSFRGVTLHIHSGFVGWFGSSDAGYNDYCIDAFEKRWDVKVPVDRADPDRAGKYAAWLRANAWEKWRIWRCETAGGFWIAQAKKLKAARSDLKLWFNFMSCEGGGDIRRNFMKFDCTRQMHLDGGFDPQMIGKACDNVIFADSFCPADARHGILHGLYDLAPNARQHLEKRWQEPGYHAALDGVPHRWTHQHDRYWESNIGDSRVRGPNGSKPLSCDWMTEHNWRVSTLNPPGRDALKHFAIPLRFADIGGMTKGGFLIGTYGMEEYLVPFAQALRALPDVPFETVSSDAGVVVRRATVGGVTWTYVVNTTDKDVTAKVDLPRGSVDAVSGAKATGRLDLAPWELRSFRAKKGFWPF